MIIDSKEKVLNFIRERKHIKTSDVAGFLGVSRQRAHSLLSNLLKEKRIIKIGSTAKASYAWPEYAANHLEVYPNKFKKTYKRAGLKEEVVIEEIEEKLPQIKSFTKNIQQLFRYAFLEMMNNAIEHSQSPAIEAEIAIGDNKLSFIVNDFGVGVFRNVMKNKKLKSELEAIQDILKGKTTTVPENHTGQGIFFTSKSGDIFNLESFDYQLIVNNKIDDIFLKKPKGSKRGTRVGFSLALNSKKDLADIFKKYTNIGEDSDYGFDRTEVKVKLYTREGIYISRSQARRILVGVDQFESIVLDFNKVETVGQGFADEIFRVFHKKHPDIKIIPTNMNEAVKFMVERVD